MKIFNLLICTFLACISIELARGQAASWNGYDPITQTPPDPVYMSDGSVSTKFLPFREFHVGMNVPAETDSEIHVRPLYLQVADYTVKYDGNGNPVPDQFDSPYAEMDFLGARIVKPQSNSPERMPSIKYFEVPVETEVAIVARFVDSNNKPIEGDEPYVKIVKLYPKAQATFMRSNIVLRPNWNGYDPIIHIPPPPRYDGNGSVITKFMPFPEMRLYEVVYHEYQDVFIRVDAWETKSINGVLTYVPHSPSPYAQLRNNEAMKIDYTDIRPDIMPEIQYLSPPKTVTIAIVAYFVDSSGKPYSGTGYYPEYITLTGR